MNATIRKIGNSEGIIIPKDVLDRMGLKAGDTLEIREENGNIALVPEQADLAEQLKAARLGMEKYRIALRELAK
ncbi:AbrB/MazE/SpoVT family DNA-binding domain-containing protein [Neorhizobium sp. NPDC001467]|jgi:putative addiction module antidote|uniref:AbrB/MazE/SpoVT family DNA-binding domain-containing protein n=2 Tax=Rhizobiaceae TaxID=82115 RepID=A0A6A8AAY7_9HYPH|nr:MULTISPECIES: AbrB/MazE/SpoVT family DNA-binding domain-containing protein [Rhizobiaceae]MDP9839052.1 putative addiction module antidote [Neorhizobium huautlense]MEB2844013.1 AbrB/MazE/SpoVT family DNA-binding domain-containing protein [Endobacterium cereale]MQY48425.1 AbrB/MazE/SpoVT family DNA-binding domain-containing protein [Endobacterium cereale]